MKELTFLFAVCMWIGGIVLAKGFWMTVAAIFIPFASWYIVISEVFAKYSVGA